jgi:sortase (surface protein transpeptidase)
MTEESIHHVYKGADKPEEAPISAMDSEIPSLWPEMAPDIFLPEASVREKKRLITSHFLLSRLATSFAVVGLVLLIISYGPSAFFWAQSRITGLSSESNFELTQTEVENLSEPTQAQRSTYQPPFNPRLPKTNRLTISAIGVQTEILEASYDNYEAVLRKGVWRVADFGEPATNTAPTILAAHRFGYLEWSNAYRRQNSFYNLPKLKVGDVVEIIWRQRKYKYEVYAEGRGQEITDYNADLILYTCVDLSGPERIFKYARLLEI